MESVDIEKSNLIEWLKHPKELGKEPQAIEYVKTFEDDEGCGCMIFKYRKSMLSPWLLAIASDAGVFSHMEKYVPKTADQDAAELLASLKKFWKNKAAEESERAERAKNAGKFLSFVLLMEEQWDHGKFENDFEADWGIRLKAPEAKEGDDMTTVVYSPGDSDSAIFLAISLIGAPVPEKEAEYYAQFNYMWKDAVEVTKSHKAHMILTVMGSSDPMESGVLFAKALTTVCRCDNTLGVYYNDVVASPEFLVDVSQLIKQDEFPMLSLIWFGLGRSQKGYSAYTVGLTRFGKDELEIVDSDKDPRDIRGLLMDITAYVIGQDVILHDGETIGFTNEQRLKIVRSEGVNVQGDSLKILY